MKNNISFAVNGITYALLLSLAGAPADAVDFRADVLDAADRQNIDFASQAGYILPGQYQMEIMVNDQGISPSAFPVTFLEPPVSGQDGSSHHPTGCPPRRRWSAGWLTEASQEKVTYWNNGQCADFSRLPGVEIRRIRQKGCCTSICRRPGWNIPDASWLPPSRWDNGIPGLLFDYNINGTVNKPHKGKQSQSLSYNGTAGAKFVPGVCVRTIRAT
ncbi:FimD/PapC N-terminal domain-containing protein [Escherichia coli]